MYFGYFDGSSSPINKLAGIGACIFDDKDNIICEVSEVIENYKDNNEIEYMALIRLLQEAIEMGIKEMIIYGDSSKVIKQISTTHRSKRFQLAALKKEVLKLLQYIKVEFIRIPRFKNRYADNLSNSYNIS